MAYIATNVSAMLRFHYNLMSFDAFYIIYCYMFFLFAIFSLSKVHMKPLAQMEARSPPPGVATGHRHQPVFGVQEVPVEKLREQRERARDLFLEQLTMVAEKERKVKEIAHKTQVEEADMLTRTRKE